MKTLLAIFALALLPLAALAAEPPPIAAEARCPVCGMAPARYPKWAAQIIFEDGKQAAFDSPADLFRFTQNLARYDAKHAARDIARLYVSDYAKGGWLEARQAYFVAGSRARGPMRGPDLPAFASEEDAKFFASRRGGGVLAYAEITPAVIAALGDGGDAGTQAHEHAPH